MFGSPYLLTYLRLLVEGALTTLRLSLLSLLLGSIVGLAVGLMRTSRRTWLRTLSLGYVELFRSVPLLLQLFFVYYALPLVLNVDIPPYPSAVISLSLYTGGYMADVIKSGIEAIHVGQWEAAYSLRMNYFQAFRYVILPQALRVIIPPAVGVYIGSLKDSSLASIVGYVELLGTGVSIRDSNAGRGTFDVLLVVAALYFVICYSLSLLGRYAERKLQV